MNEHRPVLIATIGGTLTAWWQAIQSSEPFHTAVLAIEGAVISYGTTLLLQWWRKKRR
jgi:hypothetical protein